MDVFEIRRRLADATQRAEAVAAELRELKAAAEALPDNPHYRVFAFDADGVPFECSTAGVRFPPTRPPWHSDA